jgi:hypothetical protein
MQNTSVSHLGFRIALVMGLMTAAAATIAVLVQAKRTVEPVGDAFDNWEEALGI